MNGVGSPLSQIDHMDVGDIKVDSGYLEEEELKRGGIVVLVEDMKGDMAWGYGEGFTIIR